MFGRSVGSPEYTQIHFLKYYKYFRPDSLRNASSREWSGPGSTREVSLQGVGGEGTGLGERERGWGKGEGWRGNGAGGKGRAGGLKGWRAGGMEGWRDGGMEGWRDGEMEG